MLGDCFWEKCLLLGHAEAFQRSQCISERLQYNRVYTLGLKVYAEKKPSLDLPAVLADHVRCQSSGANTYLTPRHVCRASLALFSTAEMVARRKSQGRGLSLQNGWDKKMAFFLLSVLFDWNTSYLNKESQLYAKLLTVLSKTKRGNIFETQNYVHVPQHSNKSAICEILCSFKSYLTSFRSL